MNRFVDFVFNRDNYFDKSVRSRKNAVIVMYFSFFLASLPVNVFSILSTYSDPIISDILFVLIFALPRALGTGFFFLAGYLLLWAISGTIIKHWSKKDCLDELFYTFSYTSPAWIIIGPMAVLWFHLSFSDLFYIVPSLAPALIWSYKVAQEMEKSSGVQRSKTVIAVSLPLLVYSSIPLVLVTLYVLLYAYGGAA